MNAIKIGLDFGTYQTKICIEDSSDKRNKRYYFCRFIDLEGNEHWTIPSIVQVNKDKTLSYGFTEIRDVFMNDHAPGEPPNKPKEPIYKEYIQLDPIVKPEILKTFEEDEQLNKPQVFSDFASLKALVEKEERKLAKQKIAKLRYEEEILAYNKVCQERENKLKKDKEDVDRINDKLRKDYEKELKKYEKQYIEYNAPHPYIFRNFKQAIFSTGINWVYQNIMPEMVAVWYLSFIFFDLEKEYGNEIVVCMGASSGISDWDRNKKKATQIMLSVYYVVENVCKNDKQFFLSLTIDELIKCTKILPFSQAEKDANSIFVFPEAYANINPLAQQRRFGIGINAIIDIGGGTTDISIFSVYEKTDSEKIGDISVEIYDYISIPYGVNAIEEYGNELHFRKVRECIQRITSQLQKYSESIGVSQTESKAITNYRPVVFSGGGSLRPELCIEYDGFTDIIHITSDMVSDTSIDEINKISNSLAMLNTALGLAKCKVDDSEIPLKSYKVLFSNVKEAYKNKKYEDNFNLHNEHGLLDD